MLMVQDNNKGQALPQIIVILACSFMGITEGMLFAWNAPAVPELVSDKSKNISLENASYFTMIGPVAMLITAPLFPLLMDKIGRRITILLVAVPAILAWIFVLLNGTIWMYYISRFLAGMVDAGTFTVVPVYVCEIAQPKIRGIWGNGPGISMYVGVFLINLIGAYNNILITAGISISIPIIHIAIFLFMPESPYYLLMKNKEEDARECLKRLRKIDDIEQEFKSLKVAVQRQLSEPGTIKDLFLIESNRKALFICILIRVTQQLSGLSAFESYTQYMFQKSGSNISEKFSSVIFTAFIAVFPALCLYFVRRFGRRPLLMASSFGCGIIFLVLSIFFYITDYTNLNISNLKWIPLTGMLVYVLFYAPGLALIPTVITGELFSSSIKSKAVSVSIMIQSICFLTVPKFFQATIHNFGIFVPFAAFSLSCIVGGVLFYLYVIETHGKTLEEIQLHLKGYQKVRTEPEEHVQTTV